MTSKTLDDWGMEVAAGRCPYRSAASANTNSPAAIAERLANRADCSWENLIQDRDPCPMCGTRADRHEQFGCKNGRGK